MAVSFVIITYSFMTKTTYFGPKGERKDVTEQVEPSRFLYEIMPDSNVEKSLGIEWNDGVGFKEIIAGRDLPLFYRKSYRIPDGYRSNKSVRKPNTKSEKDHCDKNEMFHTVKPNIKSEKDHCDKNEMFETVQVGLNSIFSKTRGACKKYRPLFREFLREKGIIKGRAPVMTAKAQKERVNDIYALANATENQITTRPLSRCTAQEMGLYLVSLLKK